MPAPVTNPAASGATPPAAPTGAAGGRASGGLLDRLRGAPPKMGNPLDIPEQPSAIPPAAPVVGDSPPVEKPPVVEQPPVEKPPSQVIGAGGKPLSQEALNERMKRHEDSLLRKYFGTSDPEEIKRIRALSEQDRADLENFRKSDEQRKREQMSEMEKLQADLEAERTRATAAEERLQAYEESNTVNKQTEEITKIAGEFIRPKSVRFALREFQDHLRGLSTEDIQRMTPGAIKRWFREFANENEDFKIVAEPPTTETPPATPPATVQTPKAPVRKIPLTTSHAPKGGPAKPPAVKDGPDTVNGKTFRPGQPNSMTKKEVDEALKKQGRRVWG